MRKVPREAFVPPHLAELAYEDGALPIGEGQTISQPYIVALMTQAAEIGGDSHVLEIGTGSGYSTALLAAIAKDVISIERHETLVLAARARLSRVGLSRNVKVLVGDGTMGAPEAAPFDAIVVTAAGPRIPEALKAQLAVGGRLVIPVGAATGAQTLTLLRRDGTGAFHSQVLAQVSFVPLIGAQGWPR